MNIYSASEVDKQHTKQWLFCKRNLTLRLLTNTCNYKIPVFLGHGTHPGRPSPFLPSPQHHLSQVMLFLLDIYRLYSVFSCFSCKFWTEISIQYGRRTNLPTAMSNMTVYSSTLPLPETIVRIVLDSAGVEKKIFLEDHFLSKFWPFGGWRVQTNDNWMRHTAQTCSLWHELYSVPSRWPSVWI